MEERRFQTIEQRLDNAEERLSNLTNSVADYSVRVEQALSQYTGTKLKLDGIERRLERIMEHLGVPK